MISNIIRVEPAVKNFSINWMLGSFCNYDCMYCPSEYHDAQSTPHDLNTLKKAWENIYNATRHKELPYKIAFTGGEVTANRQFLPFVRWLRENFPAIEFMAVTTNGSASTNYYLKLSKIVDSISFSVHSEFMDEKKFFNTVIKINQVMLRPAKSFHVCVMNEYWNQHRIDIYKRFLDQHNVSYSINEIDYTKRIREYPLLQGRLNFDRF